MQNSQRQLIASKLGVTKAALYKHYKSRQEILDSIIEKMNELDRERVKQYEMPEGDLETLFQRHCIPVTPLYRNCIKHIRYCHNSGAQWNLLS